MKKILSLLLAFTMLACVALTLASCGGGDNTEKTTYTVTVKDQYGEPVKNVQLVFKETDTNKMLPAQTDSTGVATYETASSSVTVTIVTASGYSYDGSTPYTFTSSKLDITLEKLTADTEIYTVYVKDADGNPVAGANVHICKADNEGMCLSPKTTDSEGKATFEVAVGSQWKAKFVDGSEYVYFEDGSKEVTLTK